MEQVRGHGLTLAASLALLVLVRWPRQGQAEVRFAGGHAKRWRGEDRRRSGPTPIFTMWMVEKLDKEAKRLVTTGQSVIKMRLAERLDRPPADRAANPLH